MSWFLKRGKEMYAITDKIKLEDMIKSNKNLEKIEMLSRNGENLYRFNDKRAKH